MIYFCVIYTVLGLIAAMWATRRFHMDLDSNDEDATMVLGGIFVAAFCAWPAIAVALLLYLLGRLIKMVLVK